MIDDDPQIQTFLQQVLEKAGYDVLVASNGRVALRMIEMSSPDLVLTDLLMPDMDGLEVTRALHRGSPHTRIIAFTGGSLEFDYLDIVRTFGAHRTLRKPLNRPELLEAVKQELQKAVGIRQGRRQLDDDSSR